MSTLAAKAQTLRTNLEIAEEVPVAAVVAKAIEELGLATEVQELNLMQKADACLAALGASEVSAMPVTQAEVVPMEAPVELAELVPMTAAGEVAPPFIPEPVPEDETIRAEARAREAELRAQRAEAELRVREAEMRAHAVEQALAQQTREAEERARREAYKFPASLLAGDWSRVDGCGNRVDFLITAFPYDENKCIFKVIGYFPHPACGMTCPWGAPELTREGPGTDAFSGMMDTRRHRITVIDINTLRWNFRESTRRSPSNGLAISA